MKTVLCPHIFIMRHQFGSFQKCKKSLKDNSAVIHIDFSENYCCKLHSEIQSMHFGASRNQVSLHTGVQYTSSKEPQSFCTISDSRFHSPAAIWAHLSPVLKELREQGVEILHVQSDGPTSQYRNKENFFLFANNLYSLGFKGATWNFSEASHGKGAPDGVGGAIKRSADQLVANNVDIPNGKEMFHQLQKGETKVKLYYIEEAKIEASSETIPDNLTTVKGTMKFHQLITKDRGTVYCRELSCFCEKNEDLEPCNCVPLLQKVSFQHREAVIGSVVPETPIGSSFLTGPVFVEEGDWCIVKYDGTLYPGTVCSVDKAVGAEVQLMKTSL